jgi:hypothetical protein
MTSTAERTAFYVARFQDWPDPRDQRIAALEYIRFSVDGWQSEADAIADVRAIFSALDQVKQHK